MIFAEGLRGAGDTRFPMMITSLSTWFVLLPLAYLFALVFGWGLAGAWAAMALDMSIRGIGNYLRWRSGRWKGIEV
jgi:Na+-driven multidrug efflux pump